MQGAVQYNNYVPLNRVLYEWFDTFSLLRSGFYYSALRFTIAVYLQLERGIVRYTHVVRSFLESTSYAMNEAVFNANLLFIVWRRLIELR